MKKAILFAGAILIFFTGFSQGGMKPLQRFTLPPSRVVSDGAMQQLKQQLYPGAARRIEGIILDYDAVNENFASDYQRYIWKLNSNFPADTVNRANLRWAAVTFDSLFDANSFTGYPHAEATITVDSFAVAIQHENVTGTLDTIILSLYLHQGQFGITIDSNLNITNPVLKADTIITSTSLTPSGTNQYLISRPNITLAEGQRFTVGVHFYGDTMNDFFILAGMDDQCFGSCGSEVSVFPDNSFAEYILQDGSSALSNSLYLDCDQSSSITPGGCEYIYTQNFMILSFISADIPFPPIADFVANPTSVLTGNSVSFTDLSINQPSSWWWDFGDGTFDTINGVQNPVHIYSAPGIYDVTLIVTNSDGADTLLKPAYIAVSDDTCPAIGFIYSITDLTCNGDSSGLIIIDSLSGATPPVAYLWSTGATSGNIASLPAGTYSVTITDDNFCTATGSATVNEPAPIPVQIAPVSGTICTGESVTLTASGGLFYSWSSGPTSASILVSNAGVYAVTASDVSGCTASASATVNVAVCDDGNACTDDDCSSGNCLNTTLDCDDSDVCTIDACDTLSGCVNSFITCDDSTACTFDFCDALTGCDFQAVNCDDGDACTIDDCDPLTGCGYTSINCDDSDTCTVDVCQNGGCVFSNTCGCSFDFECDDGSACTFDICDTVQSACTYTPAVCDDSDQCTWDDCDALTGCYYTPVDCNDEDECTVDDCDAVSGCFATPINCDDSDACTADSCDALTGCFFTSVICDDSDLCTVDSCLSGSCQFSPISCDDSDICTNDSCGSGICVFDTIPGCNDPCFSITCDDSDLCTTDSCFNGACIFNPILCDDSNACTDDLCLSGICNYIPINCDDSDTCTIDNCDTLSGCVFTPDPLCGDPCLFITCNDSDACTSDSCFNGNCFFIPIICDDSDDCTTDICASGSCIFTPVVCDDGDTCTADVCLSGTCVFTNTCGCAFDFECDDGNACSIDVCDTAQSTCAYTAVDCDDADACTNDSCNALGGCANITISCDDQNACTADSCDALSGCFHASTACDDANVCNGLELCDTLAGCQTGIPLNCDDNNACTTDGCNALSGCTHTSIVCTDGNACTQDGCDSLTGCVFTPLVCITGEVRTYLGPPVSFGNVYLFDISNATGGFDTIVVVPLDVNGFYRFPGVIQSKFIIQAVPDPDVYYYLMPAYLGNGTLWTESDTIDLQNLPPAVIICPQVPFEQTGNSTITGTVISYLTGKRFAADPIKNADVTLKNLSTGALSGFVSTDDNGQFTFTNVEQGDYKLYVDYPGIPMSAENDVTVTSVGEYVNVSVRVDSAVISIEVFTSVPAVADFQAIEVFPNPFSENLFVKLDSRESQNVNLIIREVSGKEIFNHHYNLKAGANKLELSLPRLNGSVYFLSIKDVNGISLSPVIKLAVVH